MSKLNKKPRSQNQRGRTVHDLSHNFKFTAACGHILPVESDIILPGDTINCKVNLFGRNIQPFLAPAFAEFDFHIDYFFVPMQLLFQKFDNIVYGIKSQFSSAIPQQTGSSNLPYIQAVDLKRFLGWAGESVFSDRLSFEQFGCGAIRLLDMFGINSVGVLSEETRAHDNFCPNFFPWQLAAYQAVYQYYYRDEDLEDFNNSSFNLDQYSSVHVIPSPSRSVTSLDNYPFAQLLRMRYHRAYGDYFQSSKRSPLLNGRNLFQFNFNNLLSVYNDLGSSSIRSVGQQFDDETISSLSSFNSSFRPAVNYEDAPLSISQAAGAPFDGQYNTGNFEDVDSNYARSIDQLRKLFAVEKLLTITERSKKTYDAQTLAHFGVKVPHDVKHEISHIGHDKATFKTQEITALAEGSNVAFGEYSAKGQVGLEGKGCRFTAPCHGVFLATFSIVPRYDYVVRNYRRNFVKDRLDFFQPEFDHLGMQPLYRYEVTDYINVTDDNIDADGHFYAPKVAAEPQGWIYRYQQFKQGINRASPAFLNSVFSSWALTRSPFRAQTAFGTYTESGLSTNNSYYSNQGYNYAYVAPQDSNGIFATLYSGAWSSDYIYEPQRLYLRDPFMLFSHIDYKKVSIMSTYSVPKLD